MTGSEVLRIWTFCVSGGLFSVATYFACPGFVHDSFALQHVWDRCLVWD
jgi:hypothetical protein